METTEPIASIGSTFEPDVASFYEGDWAEAFSVLRDQDPVHWYEPGGFWCVTRHADIREVSRAPERFSSARGLQMWQIAAARAGEPFHVDGATDASILEMDPPDHIRHRRLVSSAFTPRLIRGLEGRIREIARRSLDGCDESGVVDLVEEVAVPLPMLVIAEMIGVPGTDLPRFRRWSDSIIEAGGGGMTSEREHDLGELLVYFVDRLAEHREHPQPDIITTLLDAEIDDERLSEGEILMFLMTLLVAGNETTRNLISGGALALMEHPDQREWLAADPARIPLAVEEMLRWVSPVRSFVRFVTTDTTIGATPVAAGDHVVMFYGSGNRDRAVFGSTADEFDVSRENAGDHISFGFGEHLCLGAALSRVEARVMFEELLARWPDYQPAGAPESMPSCLMNGLRRLPVRLAA